MTVKELRSMLSALPQDMDQETFDNLDVMIPLDGQAGTFESPSFDFSGVSTLEGCGSDGQSTELDYDMFILANSGVSPIRPESKDINTGY